MQEFQDLLSILAIPTHDSSGLNQIIEVGRKLFKLEIIEISDAWGQVLVHDGEILPTCPSFALSDGALMRLYPAPEASPLFQQFIQRAEQLVEYLTLKGSFEEERQQRVIANTLNDISLILTSQLEAETVFSKILQQVQRVVPFDAASIWMMHGSEARLLTNLFHDDYHPATKSFYAETDPILRESLQVKRVMMIRDTHNDTRWSLLEDYAWIRSWVSTPIIVNDDVIGLFTLDHHLPNFYDDSHLPILESLSRQMSIAAQNAKMFETLRQNQAELQESLELKSRFMSTILHEFRTPLASILANSQIIERYDKRLSEEKKATYHAKIKAQVEYLTKQVEDVLLVSKAETVGFPFVLDSQNLQLFCEDLIAELNLLKAPNVSMVLEMAGTCEGIAFDSNLLRHILFNLLSNAMKYSPEGGKVGLKLHCSEAHFRLIVSDEGIGIPAAEQAKLFQNFFRASNATHINGTGLGLTIVKRAVDTYGGIISIKSEEGKGSRFEVSLPRYNVARL